MPKRIHRRRDADPGEGLEKYGEARTIRSRIRKAAKERKVALPDPDEFIELMKRVRRTS